MGLISWFWKLILYRLLKGEIYRCIHVRLFYPQLWNKKVSAYGLIFLVCLVHSVFFEKYLTGRLGSWKFFFILYLVFTSPYWFVQILWLYMYSTLHCMVIIYLCMCFIRSFQFFCFVKWPLCCFPVKLS